MPRPVSRRTVLGFLLQAPLLLAGCSAVTSEDSETPTEAPSQPTVVPPTEQVPASPTPTLAPAATATPLPPLTPTPAPTGPIGLMPATIPQGGTTTVVLNLPATSATVTFQGRQYQMLSKGDQRWAVIGTGGFTEPGPYTVSISYVPAAGGAALVGTTKLPVTDARFVTESIQLDAQTAALLAPDIITAELAQRAAIYSGYTLEKLWSGPFRRPSTAAVGDTYGLARSYNGAPATDYHRGVDFTGQTGDPITAAAAGRAAFVGPLKVRGNSVILDHGAGVFTAYHHLSRFDIAQGDSVSLGQRLGLIGSTGLVTGPHLHWEVIVRGIEVDGLLWLNGSEYGL